MRPHRRVAPVREATAGRRLSDSALAPPCGLGYDRRASPRSLISLRPLPQRRITRNHSARDRAVAGVLTDEGAAARRAGGDAGGRGDRLLVRRRGPLPARPAPGPRPLP